MRRSFKLKLPARLGGAASKDPRMIARAVLGILLLANLIAAYAVFNPVGGSAEELEAQISSMRSQLQQRQAGLTRMRTLVSKIEQARTGGDQFLSQYFMDRRTASSTILSELDKAAKEAGMKPKERSFAYDPVEGSETLSMMTVVANYEGTYGDLLQFVNKLDKSARFLILDTLMASPQQGGGTLSVQIKFNSFVREATGMKVGAEPKKVAILIGLLVVAVVVFFLNSGSGEEAAVTPSRPAAPASANADLPSTAAATPDRQVRGKTSVEFRPSLRPKRGEQRPDPMTIDPTLRLDVLAKLQQIDVEGSHRSVFDFSQPPAPKPEPEKLAANPPVPDPIVKPEDKPAEEAKADPPKPTAPPIPLKFYGYVSRADDPAKRAFFVEGEDIHVVHEGELVKKRYRIVRIGINSVVVEDTQFGSEQTLPLEEQQG